VFERVSCSNGLERARTGIERPGACCYNPHQALRFMGPDERGDPATGEIGSAGRRTRSTSSCRWSMTSCTGSRDPIFVRERGDHTLQPTALVHEAYLRLVDQRA